MSLGNSASCFFFFIIVDIIPTLSELLEKSHTDRTLNRLICYKKEEWYYLLNTSRAEAVLSLSFRKGDPFRGAASYLRSGVPWGRLLPHFSFLLSPTVCSPTFLSYPLPPCPWEGLVLQCVLNGWMTSSKKASRLTSTQRFAPSLFMLGMVLAFLFLVHFLWLFLWYFVRTPISLQSSKVLLPFTTCV